jgi:hypothetical protein
MLASFSRPKITCFLPYAKYRPNTNIAILRRQDMPRGGHTQEEEGKSKKLG